MEEKCHCEEVCGELNRRVKEGEEEGRRVIAEKTQLVGQLREMREQLRTEAETREAVEMRAKQEVMELREEKRLGWV